jgi:hypothetical protein
MSIFKETLESSIQTQLQARTLVVSGENNNRNRLLPWYLSKNSWVRMTSLVNYTSGNQLIPDGEKGKLSVVPDGSYNDAELSKKYILEGGTLYTKTNGSGLDGILRYGVGTPQAAYGGNIDVRPNNSADPDYFRTFGIRPMPGITEMSLRTLGAYGSLFETTVKFYAWDINQLNELEILFMRPGYSVLLEWGWSQYIDYDENFVQNFTPSNRRNSNLTQTDIYPTIFNGTTINPFEKLSQDDIYLKLEALRKKYRHNYDGMLGYVKNFTWTMMTNGGFECQTTLISMGEAINTVKMSSNVNRGNAFTIDPKAASNYAYDDYENILLSLKADVDSKYYQYLNNNTGATALLENEYRGNWNYNSNYISRDIIKNIVSEYYPNQATKIDEAPQLQEVEFKEPSETGRYYEYLTLDVWLAIVMSYFNVKSDSKKSSTTPVPLVKFQLPGDNDLCLACKDTVSVNPEICQVKNNGAFKTEMSFIGYDGDYDPSVNGINPPMYQFEDGNKFILNPNTYQFYDATLKAGKIKNIFVNISLLLKTYKDMKNSSNDEGVIMLDYIKNVLNKISNSLGGLNNFGLSTVGKTQSVMKVVDFYYLENGPDSHADQKYQFDLLGLGSICRSVNIQSQIFENQSTIVAIAAQSRANLANVYNSSQVYLNAGLEDRIALNKWQGEELDNPQGNESDVFYQKLYNFMLYARDYLIGNLIPGRGDGNDYRIKIETSGQANPSTILKQSMLRYNSELNFKALIPFKLKITLDGIGGIVVGQIFTVRQNILPKNYYDKQLGFVITQINHRLNKNDWETELETQICILDQDRKVLQDFINIERTGFGKYIAVLQAKALIYPILQDFLVYQASRAIVGFAYAKSSGAGRTNPTREPFSEVIEDNVINYKKDVVQDLWGNNIDYFLKYDPVNANSRYGLDKFKDFVVAWVKAYKATYPTTSNTLVADDQTIGNLLDQLAGSPPSAGRPDYTQEFENTLNTIQAELLQDLSVFVPTIGDSSIYANDEGDLDLTVLRYRAPGGAIPNGSIQGFNLPTLKARLDRFINKFPEMRQVKLAWNQPIPLQNTQNTYLNSQIPFNGFAVYGNSSSIVHPYYIDNNVAGPFTFDITKELQFGTPGDTWYQNGFAIGQAFASTIPWQKQIKLFAGTPREVLVYAIKLDSTVGLNRVNSLASGTRNNTNIITSTNFEYYQP